MAIRPPADQEVSLALPTQKPRKGLLLLLEQAVEYLYMSETYNPGVCNIAGPEIKHRKNTYGWGGAAVSLALFTILSFLDLSPPYYVILAIPVYTSVMGFLQAKEKFCVWYGMNGVKNMSDEAGETQEIIGEMNRRKDRQKASSIRQKAFVYTAIITVLLAVAGHLL